MPIDLLEQIHVGYMHRLVAVTMSIPTGIYRPEMWLRNVG
jgi:hypothetical protein